MEAFLSAKDLFINKDFLSISKEERDKRTSRHASKEFQAYAYRLAMDLNDLENLKIYMRLAKNTDRSLMERCYSFVADITEDRKGPLFLWKLKQLKSEIQKKADFKNFDYSFVIKEMKKIRDKLAKTLIRKGNEEFVLNTELQSFISKITLAKVLVIGSTSPLLLQTLGKENKVIGVDFSQEVTSLAKKEVSESKNIKLIYKDFLKNTFKDNYFDYVIFFQSWKFIPIESEKLVLSEVNRVLKEKGEIFLGSNNKSTHQEWKTFMLNGEELKYFQKD